MATSVRQSQRTHAALAPQHPSNHTHLGRGTARRRVHAAAAAATQPGPHGALRVPPAQRPSSSSSAAAAARRRG